MPRLPARITANPARSLLVLATGIATIATAGSLYFSLGMHLYPCRLCWYQRILMYPLVVILGVAAIENRPLAYRTAVPLALLGWGIAAYHSLIQRVDTGGWCSTLCSNVQFELFGVLTIPNLSLIAFTLILVVLAGVARADR